MSNNNDQVLKEPDFKGIETHIIKKLIDVRYANIEDQMDDPKVKINSPQWNKLQCVSVALAIVRNHLEHRQGTPIERMVKFATKDKSVTVRREFRKLCKELGIPL
ncbi:MAG: hypothetical protein WC479_08250 [Candidatus Izemoplasmatales bacterium]